MVASMKSKSSAFYQREYRRRLREQGLVKKEVWILPEYARRLSVVESQLRQRTESQWVTTVKEGMVGMSKTEMTKATMTTESGGSEARYDWTTETLFEALAGAEMFVTGRARLELIDGVQPSLHVVMGDYGDLPIFLTVFGEQIVAEAVLWSVAEVADVAKFNDAVLRTHKYFPLSTISLDRLGDDGDYYHMFGALSASSSLANVVQEIETLASNVIQATEAYGEYLTISLAAS
jgi:uncharacterized protein YjfI (DUF2170 family)